MTGTGIYAELLANRFKPACRRAGLNTRHFALDTTAFRVPPATGDPFSLDLPD
jgi:hypothetical protein